MKNSKFRTKKIRKQRKEQESEGIESVDESIHSEGTDLEEDLDTQRLIVAKRIIETNLKKGEGRKAEKDDFFTEEDPFHLADQNNIVKVDLNAKILSTLKEEKPFMELKGHRDVINNCVFVPGKDLRLITVGKDRAIILFSINEGGYKRHLISAGFPKDKNGHLDEINAVDVSHDGKYLITAGKDSLIKLWNLENLKFEDNLKGHKASVNCLLFKQNSYEFMSGSSDRSLRIWDAQQKGMMEVLYGHKSDVLDISIMSATEVVTIGLDKTPILWKMDKETQVIFEERPFFLDRVSANNRKLFITGSVDGEICVWSVSKRTPIRSINGFHHKGWISSLATRIDENFFLTGGLDEGINLFSFDQEKITYKFQINLKIKGAINQIAFNSSNQHFAVIQGSEGRIGRWVKSELKKNRILIFKNN